MQILYAVAGLESDLVSLPSSTAGSHKSLKCHQAFVCSCSPQFNFEESEVYINA